MSTYKLWGTRTFRFEERYLIYGEGAGFFALLSPKIGWRRLVEKCIFWGFRQISHKHDVLQHIEKELGSIPKDALLYYTGDYKDTSWIGIVRTEMGKISFVKLYKEAGLAEKYYARSVEATQYFSPFFRLAEPQVFSAHLLAISLLEKSHNVSIWKVWSRVCIQCATLYEQEKKENHALNWSEESSLNWIPQKWQYAPLVFGHGDLSHWNCFIDTQGMLCLIDYEEVGWYTPFYDCFHLLLKPILLHQVATLPKKECAQLARLAGCELGQIWVWLYMYLEKENQKDLTRNVVLQNPQIAKTVDYRRITQNTCKKEILMVFRSEISM